MNPDPSDQLIAFVPMWQHSRTRYLFTYRHREFMAKNTNTVEKRRREVEKKRKAEEKREKKRIRKESI